MPTNTGFTGGMLNNATLIDQRRRGGAPAGYKDTGFNGTNQGPAGGLRDPHVYERDADFNKERVGDASADALLKKLAGASSGTGGAGTTTPGAGTGTGGTPVGAPPVAPGQIPPPVPAPDIHAAQDAELLRAKEKQGQIATSSLTGLREALGDRQMLGSGAEAMATADVAGQAAGNLSDLNVSQMKEADESARRLAELSYNGGVTQRGQDIGAGVAYRGQDVTSRGQDLAAANANMSQQQQLIAALRSLVY